MAIKKTFVKIEMVDTIRSIEEKNLERFQLKGWKLVKGAKVEVKEDKSSKTEAKKELDV